MTACFFCQHLPAMYVCVCNGVTDHDIRRAAVDGCASVDELTMRTGCGATCGCCLPMAADLLAESAASSSGAFPVAAQADSRPPHALALAA